MQDFQILETEDLNTLATPFRQQLLQELRQPKSASALARQFDMSRQRIGYHMRALQGAGCIEAAGERQRRGLKEQLFRTRPLAWISAQTSAQLMRRKDRFAWSALLNLVSRTLNHLVWLRREADAAGKNLATLALEAELHFASPGERKAFTEELLDAVEQVVRRHEQPAAPGTRAFRLMLGAYPAPPAEPSHSDSE